MNKKDEIKRQLNLIINRLDATLEDLRQVYEQIDFIDSGTATPVQPSVPEQEITPPQREENLIDLLKRLESEFGKEENVAEPSQSALPEPSEQKEAETEELPLSSPPATVEIQPEAPIRKPAPKKSISWELLVSQNLKYVGIAVFVMGIAYAIKYAIDNDWIGESTRIMLGLAMGGLLAGAAHFMHKQYKAFSSVLAGGGISIAYFSIYWAFHEYNLLSQTATFASMVLITAFAVFISVRYNREELALVAVIGGFCTPILASKGGGNYIAFFSYIAILNAGMLLLAYFKRWQLTRIVAYLFTLLIFTAWLYNTNISETASYTGALGFATLFYLLFFGMSIIYNLRYQSPFGPRDIVLIVSNNFFYYMAGIYLLHHAMPAVTHYKMLFTILLALTNAGLAAFFYPRPGQDPQQALAQTLAGMATVFVSLIAPISLKGNQISLFWAAELALLWWLSQTLRMKGLRIYAVLLWPLVLGSTFIDMQQFYKLSFFGADGSTRIVYPVIINKGMLSALFSIIGMMLWYWRTLYDESEEKVTLWLLEFSIARLRKSILFVVFLLAYVAGLQETIFQDYNQQQPYGFNNLLTGTYNHLFVAMLWLLIFYRKEYKAIQTCMLLSIIILLAYPFFGVDSTEIVRNSWLQATNTFENAAGKLHFMWHYANTLSFLLLMLAMLYGQHLATGLRDAKAVWLLWLLSAALVYVASTEFTHLYVIKYYQPGDYIYTYTQQASVFGFTVIWGLCSLVLMLAGLRYGIKTLRIISLSLFCITLLKFFLADFSAISNLGRVISLVSLGIILLLVAFLYEKLRRLILNAPPTPGEEDPQKEP